MHAATVQTALLTDQYELTMLQSALASRRGRRVAASSSSSRRRLPTGRRYGVVAGVGRALDALEQFRFTDAELGPAARRADRRRRRPSTGSPTTASPATIWGYPEGETYFPYSPSWSVEASFAEGVLLETLLLSIYNHDSAIASARVAG